jgi:hypothetical protein
LTDSYKILTLNRDILAQRTKKAAYHPDWRLKAATVSSYNSLNLLYIKKFRPIVYLSICIGAKLAEQIGDTTI